MNGKRTPRNLTPQLCKRVHKKMLAACREVAQENGLVVDDRGIKDMNLNLGFEFGVRVGMPLSDGTIFNPERSMFEVMAESYGLTPEDFGRQFLADGELFRIVGINPRRPKYPINAERLPDRRSYKFTPENIAMYLSASKA